MANYAISQKGLIGRFLPKIYIQRVTLEAQNSPLQATLQLVAKEHFDFKRKIILLLSIKIENKFLTYRIQLHLTMKILQ